jgi:hypothetical protein
MTSYASHQTHMFRGPCDECNFVSECGYGSIISGLLQLSRTLVMKLPLTFKAHVPDLCQQPSSLSLCLPVRLTFDAVDGDRGHPHATCSYETTPVAKAASSKQKGMEFRATSFSRSDVSLFIMSTCNYSFQLSNLRLLRIFHTLLYSSAAD